MKPSPRYDELDRLVASARAMEPAPLPELVARRMVRAAMGAQQEKPASRSRRLAWIVAAAVLLMCGVFAARTAWPSRTTTLAVDANDLPLRIALLAGDAVTAAPGSALELLSQTSQRRHIRVTRGTVLFDVVKLRHGEDFEVVTAHTNVHVVGTVFSVEVSEDRTLVRVYEGRVRTAYGVLTPGSTWSSSAKVVAGRDPLSEQALSAARAREGKQVEAVTVHALIPAQTPQVASSIARQPTVTVPAPPRLEVADAGVVSVATPTLVEVREMLAKGRAQEALEHARSALTGRPESELAWRSLEADALRALGKFHEAIVAYENAARLARAGERSQLAHDAAALAFSGVHDPARALSLIERWELDARDSPVRERAGRLRVHALLALRRIEDARAAARRYLALEPETAVSDEMRKMLGW